MKLKNKINTIIVLIILFIISLNTNIYAIEVEKGEYSKKYEEWLELDEEERKNTIAPLPVNIRGTTSSTISSLFNILKSTTIPTSYDLREYIDDIKVKDQMSTGLCWGFSANTALETYLALNDKTYDFSERHIEYNTAKNSTNGTNEEALNRNLGVGGYSTTAFTYYSRGSGPILEEDMPFENNEDPIEIEELPTNVAVQKVDDMVYFPSIYKRIENGTVIYEDASGVAYTTSEVTTIREQIKKHIMDYGGISVSVNANASYFNTNTWAYNLNKEGVYANHAVTIIGWDDTYSKDNFLSGYKPTTDGAYIVLNSWGEEWGDNGVYYVSYEDFIIESDMRGVTSVSDIEYDNLYQYDTSEMYGWINSQYAANIFTSEEDETLTEIMVGTWAEQTCNIYINTSGDDLNINKLTQIASNVTLKPGYNTIEITNGIKLTGGNRFAIVVELTGEYAGIGIECNGIGFGNVTSNAQESYASDDGISWEDLYDENDMINYCIKAYTQTEEKSIEIGEIRGTVEEGVGGIVGIPISTTYEAKGDTAKITILKNNIDVTSDFTISGNTIRGNGAYLTIECPSYVKKEEVYSIKVSLNDIDTVTKDVIFIGDISSYSITGIENKIYTGKCLVQDIKINNEIGTLREEIDYKITYTNNIIPGKATVKITGAGIYTGTVTKYFNIIPRQVTGLKLDKRGYNDLGLSWTQESGVTGYEVYKYNSSAKQYERVETLTSNSYIVPNLQEGTTYQFKVRAYKTIDGTKYYGDYSSILTVSTNTRTDISKCTITGIKNKPYTGSNITQSITVKYGSTTLKNGTHYTVSYSNNKNTGKATIKITGTGDYKGTVTKTFIIIPKQVTGFKVKSQTTSTITMSWSKVTGASGYKIYSYNYSKGQWEYVGKTTSTSYTVKKLKAGTTYKYRVRAYKTDDNTQYFGTYSSSIRTATKTKAPSISKLTTKSKKATIKWSKISGATGYEIYMATSKSGKYSKIKTITKASTVSYTKTKLTKKKTYYFKIRTYKTVDGIKIYSSYSNVKSIKIK